MPYTAISLAIYAILPLKMTAIALIFSLLAIFIEAIDASHSHWYAFFRQPGFSPAAFSCWWYTDDLSLRRHYEYFHERYLSESHWNNKYNIAERDTVSIDFSSGIVSHWVSMLVSLRHSQLVIDICNGSTPDTDRVTSASRILTAVPRPL